METLLEQDLNWCIRRLPQPVRELLARHPGELFLSGGFIRSCVTNQPISDIDLFGPTKVGLEKLAVELVEATQSKSVVTGNAVTVLQEPYDVQFIHRWLFARPEDIINSFDFSICTGVIWREPSPEFGMSYWKSACHPLFYPDLAAHRLTYLSPARNEDAGGSMLRVLKFYQRGYRISLGSLSKVISRLVKGINLEAFQETEGGWGKLGKTQEEAMANVIRGLLVEVDPFGAPEDRREEDEGN